MDAAERERWRAADRIFNELLDLPAAERDAHLVARALPPALHERIARLIAAHEAASGPLDLRPALGAAALRAPEALSGRRLGRWRLQHELGRGGMAVVYRAEAVEGPAGQAAAVKVLTLGALASAGPERFLREQQALLRLRHPYIVPLYDAGVAEDGTPWLAMALVEGERIDAWCARRAFDVEARVQRVLQVGEALAYAHRNLVIHRDIKPSNVLVDEHGHVRLLDFGIARLLGDGEAEATATGLRALTPEYAAPEQFAGAAPSTAMDVYGLGALLYRLLAEAPPRATGERMIVAPSRKAAAAPNLDATTRRLRARRLRGDLDAVLLKALADAPEARYASIEALIDDLRCWLQQRPVRARAPSLRHRVGKFVVRHRLGVAFASLLLLTLVGGIAGTAWQAALARREAARAQAAAAESQAQLAYLGSVLDVLAPATEATRELDRAQVIAEATRRARVELADQPTLLATVELSLGRVAERIGDYAQAAALYERALERRRTAFGVDSAEAAEALALSGAVRTRLDPPDPLEAERRLAAAERRLRQQRPGTPILVETLVARASNLGDQDRYQDGEALLTEAAGLCARELTDAEICEQVWLIQGMSLSRRGRNREAVAPLQVLLTVRKARYGEEHARTLFVAGELGRVYARSGEMARGLALLERVHAQQQRIYSAPTQETLRTLQDLADALSMAGQSERALALRQQHIEQTRTLLGDRHADLALGYASLGNLHFAQARFAEAAAAYRQAQTTYAALFGADQAGALISQGNYADALRELGRAAEALPLQRESLAGMERIFGADSARTASRLSNLARTEVALGHVESALRLFDRSIAIHRQRENEKEFSAAVVRGCRSQALLAAGRAEEAEAEARAALQEIEARGGRNQRYYWEGLALLGEAACAARSPECAALIRTMRAELRVPALPGIARLRLETALARAAAGRHATP